MGGSRVIALAGKPLDSEGFYFRVGHNDHVALDQLLAAGRLPADGLALDARRHDRHGHFREHANQSDIATCLDTQVMELAMPGTNSKGHAQLPWAQSGASTPKDFTPRRIEQLVAAIVARSVEGHYSQVMAPAHYISEADSEWFKVDGALTSELRSQLDDANQDRTDIVYPLALHSQVLQDRTTRAVLRRELQAWPVSMVTLRIHPFGNTAGPQVLRSVIEACRELRPNGKSLMIERSGFAGLALFALSAVDMVSSGVTAGDSFDIGRLQRPAQGASPSGFGLPRWVYVEALGTSVKVGLAAKLMASPRGKLNFACQNRNCCPNGFTDMLENPERHSALARHRQYAELARIPRSMRAEHFIHTMLTIVCDRLGRARDVDDSFKVAHRRMLAVKEMLVELQRAQSRASGPADTAHRAVPPGSTAQIISIAPRDPKGR